MNSFNFERAGSSAAPRKRFSRLLVIGITAGVLGVGSTLAANLNLNTGHPVEFGQGVSQATACTGTDYLTVTANTGYVNSVGSTDFKLTSFTLDHIPSTCWGKTFIFQAHDVSGPAISINSADTSVSATYEGSDSSSQDGSVTGAMGDNTAGSYGTFTLSVTSPVALATNVAHVFVQSIDKNNWKLLYKVIDPHLNEYGGVQYTLGYGIGANDAAAHFSGKASQIRYRMELNIPGEPVRYADVKFNAPIVSNFSAAMQSFNGDWTPTAHNLQVPAPNWNQSGASSYVLQANVTNLSVQSNMPGIVNGSGFLGRLEIWPGNYSQYVSGLLDSGGRGGDSGSYDWDDAGMNNGPGYGSFQVANVSNENGVTPHIIFAWNRWYDWTPDIGFGTDPHGNPDWTFDESNGQLLRGTPGASWNLQIFVK